MAEPLGVLLLPAKLEQFEFASHARDLLEVPRVVAVEPGRSRRGRFGGELAAERQARRLRFPGAPRVIVLYHALQYYLARSLATRHDAELWYMRFDEPGDEESSALDELARERAGRTLTLGPSQQPREDNKPLRQRLVELEIISSRPFVPGARIDRP